jgi:hypothetical protein
MHGGPVNLGDFNRQFFFGGPSGKDVPFLLDLMRIQEQQARCGPDDCVQIIYMVNETSALSKWWLLP